jgi:hypothetical protein
VKKFRLTQSKSKITMLFIVGIGVACVASWYTYQRVYSHRTTLLTLASANQGSGTNSTVATASSQQQSNTTANWLTYKSPVGNFSFNYPTTWSVSGNNIPGGNGYYINILPVSANASQHSDNDFTMEFFVGSNPDSTSPPTRIPYGTTQKLSNGVNVWTASLANSTGARPSSVCPEMQLINVNATHLSYALSNGQYLALKGGYCENQKDAPTANYNQQLVSNNWQVALSIIKSLQFK